MTIKTYSAFTYGHTITDDNKYIQFNEGAGEVTVELDIGSYTLGSFVNAIASKMNNAIGITNVYSAAIDRTTRKITISSTGNFDILAGTGSLVAVSAFSLMGFTSDQTGSNSYEAQESSGSYFEPQFLLQSFVDFENNVKTIQSSINESASGSVEVVSYGRVKFMECNVTFQTNISQGAGSVLKNDPNGESNLRNFLNYATTKAPIEFISDIDSPENFRDCLLDKTPESSKGVDYRVKELYSKGFAEYFESGKIVFREIT
jgi:hypothetical protein